MVERPTAKQQLTSLIKSGVAITAFLGSIAYMTSGTTPKDTPSKKYNTPRVVSTHAHEAHTLADKLAGAEVGDYTTRALTGFSGIVPDTLKIDYADRLERLWQAKELNAGLTDAAKEAAGERIHAYRSAAPTRMTLDDYISSADDAARTVRDHINWSTVADLKGLDAPRTRLLEDITNSLDGKDLLTYSMTELMPSRDGERNKQVYDILLQGGGREFIESTPALGDGYSSFGPYQFTSFAVFDKGDEHRGASTINRAMPFGHRIPGSVNKLRADDHHAAAALYAIDNLTGLLRSTTKKQLETLANSWARHDDDIIKFIATSHHAPTLARHAALEWIDDDLETDLTYFMPGRLELYSQKTEANFKALRPATEFNRDPPLPASRFTHVGTNSEGREVHRYVVTPGDTRSAIADRFDAYDQHFLQDAHKNTGYLNIVDQAGNAPGTIRSGDSLYVLADKHEQAE